MIIPRYPRFLDGLASHASQLSRISLDAPKKIIGTNTTDCMKSGLLYGNAAMLDGIVDHGKTGSLASLTGSSSVISLRGLNLIYKKNQENNH